MSTQTERTEAFIEANNQPRYVPMHEALGVYITRVDALQAHCRELAGKLDETTQTTKDTEHEHE